MQTNEIVILILVLLNAFQIWFWTKQIHKLIDKQMSRNFPEYVASVAPKSEPVSQLKLLGDDGLSEQEILSELNSMLS